MRSSSITNTSNQVDRLITSKKDPSKGSFQERDVAHHGENKPLLDFFSNIFSQESAPLVQNGRSPREIISRLSHLEDKERKPKSYARQRRWQGLAEDQETLESFSKTLTKEEIENLKPTSYLYINLDHLTPQQRSWFKITQIQDLLNYNILHPERQTRFIRELDQEKIQAVNLMISSIPADEELFIAIMDKLSDKQIRQLPFKLWNRGTAKWVQTLGARELKLLDLAVFWRYELYKHLKPEQFAAFEEDQIRVIHLDEEKECYKQVVTVGIEKEQCWEELLTEEGQKKRREVLKGHEESDVRVNSVPQEALKKEYRDVVGSPTPMATYALKSRISRLHADHNRHLERAEKIRSIRSYYLERKRK